MSSVVDRITRWFRASALRKHATEASLHRLMPGGGRPEDLQTFAWQGEGAETFDDRELAEEVWSIANGEVLAVGGRTNRFELRAFKLRGEEPLKVAEMVFRIVNKEADPITNDDSEAGLVRQLMRQNENLVKTIVGSNVALLHQYQTQLEYLGAQNAELHTRNVGLLADNNEQAQTRLLIAAEAESVKTRAEFNAEAGKQLIRFGSVLGSQFLRSKGLLTEGVPAPIRDLIMSLEPEQLEGLMGILSPEQAAALGELYMSFQQEEAAKKPPPERH